MDVVRASAGTKGVGTGKGPLDPPLAGFGVIPLQKGL